MQTCISDIPGTLEPVERLQNLEHRMRDSFDGTAVIRTDFDGGTEERLMDDVFVNLRSGDIVVLEAGEQVKSFIVPLRKHIGWLKAKSRVFRMDFGDANFRKPGVKKPGSAARKVKLTPDQKAALKKAKGGKKLAEAMEKGKKRSRGEGKAKGEGGKKAKGGKRARG